MSKRNKKRTKRYTGEDAKQLQPAESQPVVHRYEAIDRGRIGQWWFEKKRTVKIIAGVAAIVLIIIWLIVELFQIIF